MRTTFYLPGWEHIVALQLSSRMKCCSGRSCLPPYILLYKALGVQTKLCNAHLQNISLGSTWWGSTVGLCDLKILADSYVLETQIV